MPCYNSHAAILRSLNRSRSLTNSRRTSPARQPHGRDNGPTESGALPPHIRSSEVLDPRPSLARTNTMPLSGLSTALEWDFMRPPSFPERDVESMAQSLITAAQRNPFKGLDPCYNSKIYYVVEAYGRGKKEKSALESSLNESNEYVTRLQVELRNEQILRQSQKDAFEAELQRLLSEPDRFAAQKTSVTTGTSCSESTIQQTSPPVPQNRSPSEGCLAQPASLLFMRNTNTVINDSPSGLTRPNDTELPSSHHGPFGLAQKELHEQQSTRMSAPLYLQPNIEERWSSGPRRTSKSAPVRGMTASLSEEEFRKIEPFVELLSSRFSIPPHEAFERAMDLWSTASASTSKSSGQSSGRTLVNEGFDAYPHIVGKCDDMSPPSIENLDLVSWSSDGAGSYILSSPVGASFGRLRRARSSSSLSTVIPLRKSSIVKSGSSQVDDGDKLEPLLC